MKYAEIQAFLIHIFPYMNRIKSVFSLGLLYNTFYCIFCFVNKTYSQITKEPDGFKMQIFKVLFSEVREPTD